MTVLKTTIRMVIGGEDHDHGDGDSAVGDGVAVDANGIGGADVDDMCDGW